MVIKIKSRNKYFLDLLCKNPTTDQGLYLKPLKNGVVVGNTVDDNHYEIVFQDTKYSYLPEDSNQIDFQSYCNPLVVIHICNEFFGHALKSRQEYCNKNISWLNKTQGELDTEACTIEVSGFYIHSNWNKEGEFLLAKYFHGIKVEQIQGRVFKLTIQEKSVFDALNLLSLVSVFTHITNEYGVFVFIDDYFATKYARILTNLDQVPYFVFYLFIKRTIKSERQFKEIAPLFEEYFAQRGRSAEFSYYDNYQDRIRFVTAHLEENLPILDIGCGEFTYYKRLMNKGFRADYYAIDKDENYQQISEKMNLRYDQDNLYFYTSLDEYTYTGKVNIILTEVIEHNSLEDAKALIKKVLTYNFNKIIITTPNVEFNPFYGIEEFRHDDHHFELDSKQFTQLINECIADSKVKTQYTALGDKIDGIQPTQAVVIERNN